MLRIVFYYVPQARSIFVLRRITFKYRDDLYNSFFHLVNEPASRRSVFATVFVLCHYYPNII